MIPKQIPQKIDQRNRLLSTTTKFQSQRIFNQPTLPNMNRISILVNKIMPRTMSRQSQTQIVRIINSNKPLVSSLEQIAHVMINNGMIQTNQEEDTSSENRQTWISDKLIHYLSDRHLLDSNSTVVDIGGGDGYVLANIGRAMGIAKENLICVEQNPSDSTWSEAYSFPNKDTITYDLDGKFVPIKANAKVTLDKPFVNIVILMVTLHHMSTPVVMQVIQSAYNMLIPGGVLLVKEHDISDRDSLHAVNWEHHLYHLTETKLQKETLTEELTDYVNNRYVANYRSKPEWNGLFSSCKFTLMDERTRVFDEINNKHVDSKNATNLYWQVWQK